MSHPLTPQPRVIVAGFGLLTPLGHSAWETFTALLAGRTIADRTADLPDDVAPVDLVRAIGSVKVAHHAGSDPAVELAERAAREACFAAGVDPLGLPAFLGTSKGAVGAMGGAMADGRALAIALGPHGYLSHKLRERLHLGLIRHYVAACASSLTALDHAHQWLLCPSAIRHPPSAVALVLTSEAALLPPFIHSYRRLGVLAPLHPAGYRERPLDGHRPGFMLSEMGAAVVLKRLDPGEEPDIGQIELVDTATACEAEDLVRPSVEMPALGRVATRLFASAPLSGGIDVIHPHAPGTPDHDPAELAAYARALRHVGPERSEGAGGLDLYASKGALGHALGAAGLASLVLACLCLTTGRRPPMPWLANPLPWPPHSLPSPREGPGEGAFVHPISPSRDLAAPRPCSRTGAHAVFASGFAGHVAGALLKRW